MPDSARAAADNETPVNPYSLLEAVNRSSDTSHTAWLIFIGIMAYLMVAVAGVTHKDLLLETAVTLPILQVNIQLTQFFRFAPVLLVLFHLGLISQLVLLARKTLEFDMAVRALEVSDRRTHPLRLELHNFFFVQAIAGSHRSAIMGAFLHGMSWLTLVVLPVVLLLYIQISFLPYHDVAITWTHRIALGFDVLMLVLIGIFLTRAETSFFKAFWRTTLQHPMSFLVTTGVLAAVSFFSFFIATVPDEDLDRLTRTFLPTAKPEPEGRRQHYVMGFTVPYVAGRADGTLWGIFHRNLSVTDQDLVTERGRVRADEPSISLRGRDLRYARLDRTDLNRVDLTGAALDGASFVGADLSNARLQCADVSELILSEDRQLARCTSARNANFTRAELGSAHMAGIDLRGAVLEEANLEAAEMPYALLAAANFSGARLEKADLTGGVQMQGANFLVASLQGADLTGAHAQLADFSSAGMQAVALNHAALQGAVLRDADLEGANLQHAKLAGADLTGAKLTAADLRGAGVWVTQPPGQGNLALVDLENLDIAPPDDNEVAALTGMIGKLADTRLKHQVGQALLPLTNAERGKWEMSSERRSWHDLLLTHSSHPLDYPAVLTEHLLRFMCRSRWGSGAVATGIARRAQAPQFRGDITAIHDRLKSRDCPASETVSQKPFRELTLAVDGLRGN